MACVQVCYTCNSPGESDYAVSVSAIADLNAGHVCAYDTNGAPITARSSCSTCVFCCCVPNICVTKEIACFLGSTNCGAFGKFAIGVQGDTQNPAFCYRISVTNCGNCTLTNVTVIDDK